MVEIFSQKKSKISHFVQIVWQQTLRIIFYFESINPGETHEISTFASDVLKFGHFQITVPHVEIEIEDEEEDKEEEKENNPTEGENNYNMNEYDAKNEEDEYEILSK